MIEEFFKIFCTFLKTDLLESFNKRNIKIIYHLFIVFYVITSKKVPIDKKKALLEQLQIIVNEYIKDKNNIEKLKCDETIQNFQFLAHIFPSLNEFGIAMKYFLNQNPNSLFKQSLIESYNAMSHILKGIITSETNLERNILKASNHFYRASLDFYKTLIRNNFDKIDIEKLKEIRIKEFNSI